MELLNGGTVAHVTRLVSGISVDQFVQHQLETLIHC